MEHRRNHFRTIHSRLNPKGEEMMKSLRITPFAIALLMSLALASPSFAYFVVNGDINDTTAPGGISNYSGTAVAPDPGTFWNSITSSPSGALLTSNGVTNSGI